jgi:immunoglobulin-like protein involved in spore germination/sporulation and spore germination protein
MTNDDQFDELMRRALADEADRVQPTDSLHEIKSRVSSQRKVAVSRRPWVITAGAAVVGTAAAIGAFTMLGDDARNTGEPPVAGPPPTTSTTTARSAGPVTPAPSQATAPPSTVPSDLATTGKRGTPEPMVKGKAVPVYWVAKYPSDPTGVGVRLYRTYVQISGRPALQAIEVLSAGKSDDPDYYSLWMRAVPLSVTQADGVVTVDFKHLPTAKMSAGMANFAVQQLVYTVQGVFGDESQLVRVTEQGRPAATLFGQLDARQPFSRAQAADVQAKVWITAPTEGETVKFPLAVDGIAATFEAGVNWRATNMKTKQTVQGYTLTKQGQGFSPFTFTPKLTPGLWRIEAYLISPQDGRITDVDSKSVVVR